MGVGDEIQELAVFDVRSSPEDMLPRFVIAMFHRLGLAREFLFPPEVLEAFVDAVASATPHTMPFHSFRRSVDATQAAYWILVEGGASKFLDPIGVLVVILGALCFQLGHTGMSSREHCDEQTGLAKKFNNISVVQNNAAQLACGLLENSATNILQNVDPDVALVIRTSLVEVILGTDMERHPQILGAFNLIAPGFDPQRTYHRNLLAKVIVKAADVSLDIRPFTLAKYWSDMLSEEQARSAASRGIEFNPIDPCIVRMSTLDYITMPLYRAISHLLPRVGETCIATIESNRITWDALSQV